MVVLGDVIDLPSKLDSLLEGSSGDRGDAEQPFASLDKLRRLDVEGAEHAVQNRNGRDAEHRVDQPFLGGGGGVRRRRR